MTKETEQRAALADLVLPFVLNTRRDHKYAGIDAAGDIADAILAAQPAPEVKCIHGLKYPCIQAISRGCYPADTPAHPAPSTDLDAAIHYRDSLGRERVARTADEVREAWESITEYSRMWSHARRFLHRIGLTDKHGNVAALSPSSPGDIDRSPAQCK